MDMNNSSPDTPRTSAGAKKPYEKPSFRFEQVFVTTALACGKTDPLQSSCHSNLQSS